MVKKMIAALAILLGLGAGVTAVIVYMPSASNQGYQPEQPIPFSHKLHAGDNKIDCKYCHSAVERSRHSTIPSVNVCMNCHSVVKTDSPWIQKIHEHYQNGKPIEWVRVHELPDFVYFNHSRHVKKGLACETCHGPVREMDKIWQENPLTMGWCLDCHRGKTTPKKILEQIKTERGDDFDPKTHLVAPQNCSTCHF